NADGGWPTFCRGWGTLPFDRSGVDLTAHAVRAIHLWSNQIKSIWHPSLTSERLEGPDGRSTPLWGDAALHGMKDIERSPALDKAIVRGISYIKHHQRPDGSWLPLWFGNQHAPNDENPTYGTARVLAAYRDLDKMDSEPARRGVAWLLDAQNPDGGWGGAKGVPSSAEETPLAVAGSVGLSPQVPKVTQGREET